MLTVDMLRTLWRHGNDKVPGLVEGIAAAAPAVFPKFNLDSDLLIAHAMAQFSHECGAGTEMVENLNYRAEVLLSQWPTHFTEAQAQAMAHNQQAIGNQAYNGRMGNRVGTDDGFNYRGRGLSQTTGRDAYQRLGALTNLDLIGDPDLVNSPDHALECAVVDFVTICNCLPPAQRDDAREVTHRLNGGFIGLDERIAWLARWKSALGADGAQAHSTTWLQESLNKLGAAPPLDPDGDFGQKTAAALKAFQEEHGLPATGATSDETFAAIEQALAAVA
jgi:putative chitinase